MMNHFIKSLTNKSTSLRQSLLFVWESAPGLTIISTIIIFLEGLLPIASLYMLKVMLDTISYAITSPKSNASINNVALIIGIAGVVALFTNITHTISGVISEVQNRTVVDHMYDILHAKSIEVDLEYYENSKYYDTLHRAQEEATYRPILILNGITTILRSSVSLFGIVGLLFTFHWTILPLLLVAVLPSILVRLRFSKKMYVLQHQFTEEERRAWYFHTIITSVEFAKEIRIYGIGYYINRQYQLIRQKLRQLRLKIIVQRSWLELFAQLITTIAVFSTYGLIAYRALLGLTTIGGMAMFYTAFQRGQGILQELLGGIANLYESNLFLTSLFEFLNLEPKNIEPILPRPVPQPIKNGIKYEHVSFSYPNSDRETLTNININITPGEVIALVGENGAGKTTLVKLLCHLYEPTSGQISIDGININQLSSAALRQQISVIFQDYAKYNLSVRDNIWLGNVTTDPDDNMIKSAAKQASAHDFISALPKTYDTILGKLFEKGEELSIGQWQKIALARAFYRNNQIIILDEPTSAMDARSEYQFFLNFRQLLNGRTGILISHRLSTVKMADHIFVLDEGSIIEDGSHDQLVSLNGVYARLYETQSSQFR